MNILGNLSAFFIIMYQKNENVLSFLLEGYVPKNVFLYNYRLFIHENNLTPIENLLVEEKIKLWEQCKSLGISKDKIVDAARILHTLNFINENS